MKIVTWNCAGRFADTSGALFAESPDIAVVQECLSSTAGATTPLGYNVLWFGETGRKGVAVFAKERWRITPINEPSHNWVVPIAVSGPEHFTLVAVWSCPPIKKNQAYVTLIREAIEANEGWFSPSPGIVLGDFNSSVIWDQARTLHHRGLVADLDRLGLISLYHAHHGEAQGEEKRHTLHWRWNREKPFHIDYIFAPKAWLSRLNSFEVGDPDRWSSLSDHLPLIATFGSESTTE